MRERESVCERGRAIDSAHDKSAGDVAGKGEAQLQGGLLQLPPSSSFLLRSLELHGSQFLGYIPPRSFLCKSEPRATLSVFLAGPSATDG